MKPQTRHEGNERRRLWGARVRPKANAMARIHGSLLAGVSLAGVCIFFAFLSFSVRRPSLGLSVRASHPSATLRGAVRSHPPARNNLPANRLGTLAAPTGTSRARHVEVYGENAFTRLERVLRSNLNAFIEAFEDPEKILDQAMVDMKADLVKLRQASSRAMASQKQLQDKYDTARKTADGWYQRAEMALKMGEEGLAREALSRKKTFADVANGLKTQLDSNKRATSNLVSSLRQLEGKLAEAQSKKGTLKARAASARTQKQISEMVSGIDTSSSLAAFEKMEEKVIALEAEGEASMVLAGGDTVDLAFKAMESRNVEDDLAALKKTMANARPAAAESRSSATPAMKRRMDLELEMFKKELFGA